MQPTDPSAPSPALPPQPRRRTRLWVTIGVLALAILAIGTVIVVSALRSSDPALDALRHRDPNGAQACTELRDWLRGKAVDEKGQPYDSIIVALAVASPTAASTTPAIKAAYAGPLLDPQTLALLRSQGGYTGSAMALANLPKLYDGCAAAGLTLPPFTTHPAASS